MAKLRQKKRKNIIAAVAKKKGKAAAVPKREPSYDSSSSEYDYSSYDAESSESGSGGSMSSSPHSSSSSEDSRDYKKGGYHPVDLFELYNDKYRVLGKLGSGAFSTVWLCANIKSTPMELVAMKVCKSSKSVSEQTLDEMKLLSELNSPYVMSLKDHFWHAGPNGNHKCLIFDLMGENLLAVIRYFDSTGLPMPMVKKICADTLRGVAHIQSRNIIHTDIKLENVLIRRHDLKELYEEAEQAIKMFEERRKVQEDKKKNEMANLTKNQKKRLRQKQKKAEQNGTAANDEDEKDDLPPLPKPLSRQKTKLHELILEDIHCQLTDFGNGCWVDKHFTEEIQTRQYRSPEVLLGQSYDTSTDIWSCACMFFELLTGEFLFAPKHSKSWTRDEDHMALMIELLGTFPPVDWAMKGKHAKSILTNEAKPKKIKNLKFWNLHDVLVQKYSMDSEDAMAFCDFILPMLSWKPEDRITAEEALENSWLIITDRDKELGNPTHADKKDKDDCSGTESYESYSYAAEDELDEDGDREDDFSSVRDGDGLEENSEEEEEDGEEEEEGEDEGSDVPDPDYDPSEADKIWKKKVVKDLNEDTETTKCDPDELQDKVIITTDADKVRKTPDGSNTENIDPRIYDLDMD